MNTKLITNYNKFRYNDFSCKIKIKIKLILKIKCNLKVSLVNIIMSDDENYSDSENSDQETPNKKLTIGLITAITQNHIFRFLGSLGFDPPSY